MQKHLLLIGIIFSFILSNAFGQAETKIFTTKFVPQHITYNGSDNPNECWESVAWGVSIEDGKNLYFCSMPAQALEELTKKIGDLEVTIEVAFYDQPYSDSGEDGQVKTVTLNGVVIFTDK